MKTNKKTVQPSEKTHEGAVSPRITVKQQLRRSVMSCLLWEDSFYESGVSIATRISDLVAKSKAEDVAALAIEAREAFKLRHVPLLLVREMARNEKQRHLVGETLNSVIQRPDELSEFLSIYWKDQKDAPLAAQVKKGLAKAFAKFNEYSLAKYNRDADIKLRDVLFLCHAKPKDKEQESLWKRLINDELKTPDTWEVALSSGADKKETFTRLIKENQLGSMALLRNLRNMIDAGVERKVITKAIMEMKTEKVLPYRFISAARYAPAYETELEQAMYKCLEGIEKMAGHTSLLIDVSGSMSDKLSLKSEMTRIDAACGLAILLREVCESVDVHTFSSNTVQVPNRRGFALRDAVKNSQEHASTMLAEALEDINYGANADRLIIITDEQSSQKINDPKTNGYIINVASYKNGIGYGSWNKIDGWSESVVQYIVENER